MSQFQQGQPQSTGLPGMAPPAPLFDYNAGDSDPISVTVYAADGVTPVDLTGFTLTSSVRASIYPPSPVLFSKSTGSGINFIDASAGQAAIYPNETDTATLQPGERYYIDLVRRDGSGRVKTLSIGRFRLLPRATTVAA